MLTTTSSIANLEGFKLTFRQKSHNPLYKPELDHLHGGVLEKVGEDANQSSIIIGERGRKRFPPMYSKPDEYRMGKRPLPAPETKEEVLRGKKYIPQPKRDEDNMSSKKMLFASSMKRSESSNLPTVDWQTRGQVKDPVTGLPAKDKESAIYNLESSMNRKQRISHTNLQNRNYIPEANPGDKPTKLSEHTPGYYAEGGLIPGSTIQNRKAINPLANKSSVQMVTNSNSKKLEATYATMQQKLQFEYDRAQVQSLTIAGSKQGQKVPSWEERTGCFLVSPEDEAF